MLHIEWADWYSDEDKEKLNSHTWAPFDTIYYRDLKCQECGFIIMCCVTGDDDKGYYSAESYEEPLSCKDTIIKSVLE